MRIGAWLRRRSNDPGGKDAALANLPILATLSRRERRKVEGAMRLRVCPPQTPIFSEGDRDDRLYVVIEGQVEVLQGPAKADPVCLGPGEFFGEMALIDDAPRTASAVPVETTRLLSLSRSDFRALCEAHPRIGVQVAIHLSQVISERLRETNRLLKETQISGSQSQAAGTTGASEILRQKAGGQA